MPLFTGTKFTSAARRPHGRASRRCCSRSCCCSGLNGLLVGILQSYDHFTIPAISPAVWNVVIIVLLVVLRPHFHGGYEDGNQLYAYAIAILVGDVRAAADGGRARSGGSTSACSSRIDWHDPRVRQVFMLMLPVTIGLGIVNLDQLINSVFGTLVSKEAPRRDRQRVPHLHAPAGPVQRRGRDGPVSRR